MIVFKCKDEELMSYSNSNDISLPKIGEKILLSSVREALFRVIDIEHQLKEIPSLNKIIIYMDKYMAEAKKD